MPVGKLLLLPNLLDESLSHELFLPSGLTSVISSLHGLIAESEKAGRRYLRRFLSHEHMTKIPIRLLNEHTPKQEIASLLEPILKQEVWGVISDAGLPCIADPGAELVFLAHEKKIPVETFSGPSSILMALQLSGFSGQHFSFHGYLPREIPDLEKKILELEKRAEQGTQIWIEAPYRSLKMLDALKRTLSSKTLLCITVNLTSPNQRVASMPIEEWRKTSFPLEKEPAVFLLSIAK